MITLVYYNLQIAIDRDVYYKKGVGLELPLRHQYILSILWNVTRQILIRLAPDK